MTRFGYDPEPSFSLVKLENCGREGYGFFVRLPPQAKPIPILAT